MPVTRPTLLLAEFRVRYPEFVRSDDAGKAAAQDVLITAKLKEAARSIAAEVWGNEVDSTGATPAEDGGYTLAAHLLAISPYGQAARLASNASESTYGESYKRLLSQVAVGPRAT